MSSKFFTGGAAGSTATRADGPSLQHPLFVLAKNPDLVTRRFFDADGSEVLKVIPSGIGHATIYDKEILLYSTSKLIKAIDQRKPISRRVKIHFYDFAKFSGRSKSQNSYESIEDSLVRLSGTTIETKSETSLESGGYDATHGFSLIEEFRIVGRGGRRLIARGKGKVTEACSVLCFEILIS